MQIANATSQQINSALEQLINRRTGGAINIRGIQYQILFACYKLLEQLERDSTTTMRMEGIEDVDITSPQVIENGNSYFQLKTSINQLDAGTFWDMNVLQNFIETLQADPNSQFTLVYNMKIAAGNLSTLIARKKGDDIGNFWKEKLSGFDRRISIIDFFDRVSFEHVTAEQLMDRIIKLLLGKWAVNKGTELQFLRSIFFNVVRWSADRATVQYMDVAKLFQDIHDSYSKAPVNPAVQNAWITAVSFESTHQVNSEDYYDGKAAQPIHIALGLPARRKEWEKKIREALGTADTVLIKSSSGQGKSTLAWQVAYGNREHANIYQVHNCSTFDQANAIFDFLYTRLLIGEIPLVIIDGLSSAVEAWSTVAQKCKDNGVKFIVTSREEDWFRYSADVSKISLLPVEIQLSQHEAKDIFEQFKRKNKLHSEVREWQPYWEAIHPTGLLIEYTFLLSKGEMIRDRLAAQLKFLQGTQAAAAKLEILRLVALADSLNIKVGTKKLLSYVREKIGFDIDRGMLIDELEKEYFINFEGAFVGGLHPVRSQHLVELLHRNLTLSESLLNLFTIIEPHYIQDYFINAPVLLKQTEREQFFDDVAKLLSLKEISEMVWALDGLMHSEPERYWAEHKAIFDEVYLTGGLQLFTMGSVPFSKLNTLEELAGIGLGSQEVFYNLVDKKNALPEYNPQNSDVVKLARALHKHLYGRKNLPENLEGMEFLLKWFELLKLPFNAPLPKITIEKLLAAELSQAKEMMLVFKMANPTECEAFVNKHKAEIISYLKVKTFSPTISEDNGNLHINYFLADNEVYIAHEASVYRIQLAQAFLPGYQTYCTEAILLNYPSEDIVSATRMNSQKRLTTEVIGNTFTTHLNRIWHDGILKKYRENSAYEWQKSTIRRRELGLAFATNLTQLIDSLLEGKQSKKEKCLATIDGRRRELADALAVKKDYPQAAIKYYETQNHKIEIKTIDSWLGVLGNLNSQMTKIFIPDNEQERHVAMINLRRVFYDLEEMQEAFASIEKDTSSYFDTQTLCKDENRIYERLDASAQYYIAHVINGSSLPVRVGKVAVESWWAIEKNRLLTELRTFLDELSSEKGYNFFLPSKIETNGVLDCVTFGIVDFDFQDEDKFFNLLIDLAPLGGINFNFYTIVSLGNQIANLAIRFQKEYFQVFARVINGEEDQSLEGLAPLPMTLSEELLADLPGIGLPPVSEISKGFEAKTKVLIAIWRMSEYRKRLDEKSTMELAHLNELEAEHTTEISDLLKSLIEPDEIFSEICRRSLKRESRFSEGEVIEQLNALSLRAQKSLKS